MKAIICTAFTTLIVSASSFGQTNVAYGSVEETVTDASRALLPDTLITAFSQGTQESAHSRTDGRGSYRLAYLKPGRYVIHAHHDGFDDATSFLEMMVGTEETIDFRLGVASSPQQIEVTAETPNSGSKVAAVVRTQEIDRLPLNTRDYLNLTLLVPDVSRTNIVGGSSRFATTSAVPDSGVSISSQRNLANSYLVDGLSNNDDAANLPATYYSQEVFREFQVVTSNATAEFGRAEAGFVNLATQSGSNQFHGRLYGFLRNQRLDAKNALTHTKVPVTWPQYGGTFGGPLMRDRTFFFGNYERTRQSAANIVTIAPANVLSVDAVLAAKAYPGAPIATGVFPATLKTATYFLRLDHQLTAKDQLFVHYNFYRLAQVGQQSPGSLSDVSRQTDLFTTIRFLR